MSAQNQTDVACNHWVAQIRSRSGSNVLIHIHRGAPIVAQDALSIARHTAGFGKVADVSPIGPCAQCEDEDC